MGDGRGNTFPPVIRCGLPILGFSFYLLTGTVGRGGCSVMQHRFEMLIPDANVMSHLKPLCHFPGGCMTECPKGPSLMMLAPHSKYWREGCGFPTCFGKNKHNESRCA